MVPLGVMSVPSRDVHKSGMHINDANMEVTRNARILFNIYI
jgi:hypothetical protein